MRSSFSCIKRSFSAHCGQWPYLTAGSDAIEISSFGFDNSMLSFPVKSQSGLIFLYVANNFDSVSSFIPLELSKVPLDIPVLA